MLNIIYFCFIDFEIDLNKLLFDSSMLFAFPTTLKSSSVINLMFSFSTMNLLFEAKRFFTFKKIKLVFCYYIYIILIYNIKKIKNVNKNLWVKKE